MSLETAALRNQNFGSPTRPDERNAAERAQTSTTSVVNSKYFPPGEAGDAMRNAVLVLEKSSDVNRELLQQLTGKLDEAANRSRSSTQAAVMLDSVGVTLKKPGETAALPDDVLQYMQDRGIPVTLAIGGKPPQTIDQYLDGVKRANKDYKGGPVLLTKQQFDMIKAGLDADASRNADVNTRGTLELQRIMQNLGTLLTSASNTLHQLGELLRTLTGNLR
ncbi:hypothetical protein [Pandoraea oxalativorans]|uniref:Translocator protein BipD n=1 Tax=Pandoraea oxalativorans TaxID=573737 RepID=A0A0G3IE73_9BURK|nr:hypothetical protein [Pandoraea oxalativorans]AKK24853.1 hypothetical protein MB84_29210 [Pandoraea oxalativorans]